MNALMQTRLRGKTASRNLDKQCNVGFSNETRLMLREFTSVHASCMRCVKEMHLSFTAGTRLSNTLLDVVRNHFA